MLQATEEDIDTWSNINQDTLYDLPWVWRND